MNYKCKICGMSINEKNYNYNNSAFLTKNTLDLINYCPFCGVTSAYIGKDIIPINVNIMGLRDDERKILDHAMKLEVFNSDFYEEASKLAEDNNVKKLFVGLSNIEMAHARIHMKVGEFNKLPMLTKLNYNNYDSDKKLLNLAYNREIHAVEFYNKSINTIMNENIRIIFQALSEVECEHISITK